ncbi:MAG: N-6 DNA methylase, partial [Bacteroidota bacterium]|nr:N-6 DNA methylase [Bacteroidota bacterium]
MMKVAISKVGKAKRAAQWPEAVDNIFVNNDPLVTIETGKTMAKAWIKTIAQEQQKDYAQNFVLRIIEAYWEQMYVQANSKYPLPFLLKKMVSKKLDKSALAVAEAIGTSASRIEIIDACYLIGNIYTALLPAGLRSSDGIFYTPPCLSNRLIYLAESNGVDWKNATVLDPACGNGAFLLPIGLKIKSVLKGCTSERILEHIETHLHGFEIDAFAGWMCQVFIEVGLKSILIQCSRRIKPLVKICSALDEKVCDYSSGFDLVIGNPPYGKLKLTEAIRFRFGASLYGHANLYGIFTQLAIELTATGGTIAYLTPTSFLSGEYFKKLRHFIRSQSTPTDFDFVSVRKGVFEDVLQETVMAVYKNGLSNCNEVYVNQVTTSTGGYCKVETSGKFELPEDLSEPWILPRLPTQAGAVRAMRGLNFRLSDWGYRVSTGPLVWNRHKGQLKEKSGQNCFPLVWSESVLQNGSFKLKAEKANHLPYFKFKKGDDWLVTRQTCILLQR